MAEVGETKEKLEIGGKEGKGPLVSCRNPRSVTAQI